MVNTLERVFLLGALLSAVLATPVLADGSKQIAFPGAEGFGKYARGGRGGDVYHVTNLNDEGPGSLRCGIDTADGPRTIVFDVAGTIRLATPIRMENKSRLTIAGQTAPGKGITISDRVVLMRECSDVVVRYLRLRLGDKNTGNASEDVMTVDYCDQIILDHLSLSWGVDGNSDYRGDSNMTLQWLLYAEALNDSVHHKGSHAMCTSLRDCKGNTTLHHNIYSTSRDRHPTIGSGAPAKGFAHVLVDFRNCVNYNWRGPTNFGGMKINVVNNYYKPGPCSDLQRQPMHMKDSDTTKARGFMAGNHFEKMPQRSKDNYAAVLYTNSGNYMSTTREKWVSDKPFELGDFKPCTQNARDAYETALRYSGCSLVRDRVDERIIANIVSGKGELIDSQDEVGGWDRYPEARRPDDWDTDRDGIPGAWENAHGLDSEDPADRNGDMDGDGYTNLEKYINSLVPNMTKVVNRLEDKRTGGTASWEPPKSAPGGENGTVGLTRSRWNYDRNLDRTPEKAWEIGQDKYGPIVRVNLLKIRDWSEVPGILKHWSVPKWKGSDRFTWHATRSQVLDFNGDGELDIFLDHGGTHPLPALYDLSGEVIREFPRRYARVMRLNEAGEEVWSREVKPCGGGERVHVVDLDCDGTMEVIIMQRGEIFALDAGTGKTRWHTTVASGQGDFAMGPKVAHFTDPERLGVVVRAGHDILCYDHLGKQVWKTTIGGDFGGEVQHYDVDGDGLDEVFAHVNRRTCGIDHDGKMLWRDAEQGTHSDAVAFGDVDGDGRIEAIYDHDGDGHSLGPFYIVDAITGEVERKIDYRATGHSDVQNISVADFCPDVSGLEIAANAHPYDQFSSFITIWDARGNMLKRIHTPVCGFTVGDWNGDGASDMLVTALGCNTDPTFSVWTGKGERLYALSLLPSPTEPIYEYGDYMVGGSRDFGPDRNGNGKADFFFIWGAWHFGTDQMILWMEPPSDS